MLISQHNVPIPTLYPIGEGMAFCRVGVVRLKVSHVKAGKQGGKIIRSGEEFGKSMLRL
jgi:hypothetical protein